MRTPAITTDTPAVKTWLHNGKVVTVSYPTAATAAVAKAVKAAARAKRADGFAQAPSFALTAARLVKNGYRPIPLAHDSKVPAVAAWNSDYRFDPAHPDKYACPIKFGPVVSYPRYATGIVCGDVVGIDVDVRDPATARKLDRLAEKMLGASPKRYGRRPKFLRLYRAEVPFAKIRSAAYAMPNDDTRSPSYKAHAVEVLAEGQQFAAYGIHCTTRKPYVWEGGHPLITPVSELTLISEAQCREFVAAAEALMLKGGAAVYGKPRAAKARSTDAQRPAAVLPASLQRALSADAAQAAKNVAGPDLRARNVAECRRAIAAIPNRNLQWDDWVRVGLAIAGALGDAGRNDWHAFSRKSGKYDQRQTESAWRGFLKTDATVGLRIGAGWIYHEAERAGWRRNAARALPRSRLAA